MDPRPLVLRSRRVVTPQGLQEAAVTVRGGRIERVGSGGAPTDAVVVDAGAAVVMPGLVDSHVHVNDPGRTDWEGFHSATRAAAAGGITTIVDMPLNSIPPTTSPEALSAKREAAEGNCFVDVAFWGGLVPGNADVLSALATEGVAGFKCFLVPSGVDEFPHLSEVELRGALPVLSELGLPLLVHAELPDLLAADVPQDAPGDYSTYLASRPAVAEDRAVDLLLELCRRQPATVHVAHLSSAGAVSALRNAREGGVSISAETCPHYLFFAAEEVPAGATEFKCAPPIRDEQNRQRLWEALGAGDVAMVVSDHSPAPAQLKAGNFLAAWGGIASLQLSLAVTWTAGRARGYTVAALARWMATEPAKLAGLGDRKGVIAAGYDADLVVWDPEASFVVDPARLQHRHPLTPYAGRTLQGVVQQTFLRGEMIYDQGEIPMPPRGELLRRGKS